MKLKEISTEEAIAMCAAEPKPCEEEKVGNKGKVFRLVEMKWTDSAYDLAQTTAFYVSE